jgi:hypothetical protein
MPTTAYWGCFTTQRPLNSAAPVSQRSAPRMSMLDVECLVFEYTSAKRHRLTPKPSFYSHQHAVSCQPGTYRIGGSGAARASPRVFRLPRYSTRPVSASARPATREQSAVQAPPVWIRGVRASPCAADEVASWTWRRASGPSCTDALALCKRHVAICLQASSSVTMRTAPLHNTTIAGALSAHSTADTTGTADIAKIENGRVIEHQHGVWLR